MSRHACVRSLSFRSSSLVALASLAVVLTSGCHRDPNARKQKYFESGERYEKKGEFREAMIQFQNALRFDKDFAAAHYELAKTYTALAMPTQAYGELMKTVELQPNNLPARIDLGNLLVAGRRPDLGEQQAKAVLAQEPNNADAYALLSNAASAEGKNDVALTQIQHALQLDPGRSAFNAQLGLIEAQSPQAGPQAQEHLQKAVTLDGTNVNARIALAGLQEKNGDTKGAEAQLQAAIAAQPKSLQARATLASFYLRQHNPGAAEATIRKATEDFNDDPQGAAMLSRYYQLNNQMDKDEQAYAQLTQEHPKSVPLRVNYAEILYARGNYDKAAAITKELAKDDSNDPQISVLQATLMMHQGKNTDAFNLLQKAAKDYPDNSEVKTLLGLSAAQEGKYDLAESSYRDAVQRDPRNLNAERGLAQMANRRGDQSELREVAQRVMQSYPSLPDAYVWRGTAEANDKQYDTAAADFQAAMKLNPNNAQAMMELGQVRLAQGKAAEGKALLEQAVQADPSSHALDLLVQMDLRAGQPQAAIGRIQQQLGRNPNNVALYDQLTAAQLMTRDFAGATASAKKAIDMAPNDIVARRNYTQASVASGQVAPAMNMWEQFIAAHPSDPQGPAMMGMLYEAAGDQQNAIKSYQKSLEFNPNQPAVANNLAFLMTENSQNLDVALSLAQTAHAGMPDSPDTADTLAWVYYKKGVYDAALDLLQQAAKTAPNNASIQYHLGMTLAKLNNKAEAAKHLKQAQQIDPNSTAGKGATEALAQLG